MPTKTPLALTTILAVFVGSHANADQKGSDKGPMNPSDGFWQMLDALEKDVPLTEAKLQAHLHVVFKSERDQNKRKVLVSKSVAANSYSVSLSSVRFQPDEAGAHGNLLLELAASDVQRDALEKRFPGGRWAPPPPPGYGPKGAGPTYSLDRPWGRFFFAFMSGGLRRVSFDFGGHGSPGI